MGLSADQIRLIIKAGGTIPDIAAKHDISARRIYQILGTEKPKPRATDAQVEEIRRRRRLGDSLRQIARDLKMSRTTVGNIIGEDPANPAPAMTDEEVAQIEVRAATGRSPAEIAREINRSTSGVRRVADRVAMENLQADWVQDSIIARAEKLKVGAYQLAQQTGQRVGADHILDFLARKKTMSCFKLQYLISALGGSIVWKEK